MLCNKSMKISATLLILLVAASAFALADNPVRGSAKVTLIDTSFLTGNEIKAGQYDVKWESSSPEVTVTFATKGMVVAKAQGKIVVVDKNYEFDTCRTLKDSSGRVVIKELHFSGKNIRIVFE